MGGGRADRRAGPMPRSGEAPVGGQGLTSDDWPQATDQTMRAAPDQCQGVSRLLPPA